MDKKLLVSLSELSERTGLPVAWLKREAEAGRVPCIRAGRRRFFDPEAVRKSLAVSVPDGHAQPRADELGAAFVLAAMKMCEAFSEAQSAAHRGEGVSRAQ